MAPSIADLPVVDDLNVPVDPDQYVDQANPAPLYPGNYRFVVVKSSVRTNKDGSIQLQDGKFPTIVLEQAKVVEPTDSERGVGLFQDVRTKPFARKGTGGIEIPASELYDLLRAYDETVRIDDFEHAKLLLQEYFDTNASFLAQVKWTGYDKQYVEQEFAKIGGKDQATKEVANAIYAKARKGTKDFTVNGALVTSISGPSGAAIEPRVALSRYFPSLTEIGSGKDARNRQRIELGAFKKK